MRCVTCEDITLNPIAITSEVAHVTMYSHEYRLQRGNIRAIGKVGDHRFSGSWSNLDQTFLCVFRVVPMTIVKYSPGGWRKFWPEVFSTAKCNARRKWLLLLLLCCFDHLLCAYKPSQMSILTYICNVQTPTKVAKAVRPLERIW